jgi:hypothetical protein
MCFRLGDDDDGDDDVGIGCEVGTDKMAMVLVVGSGLSSLIDGFVSCLLRLPFRLSPLLNRTPILCFLKSYIQYYC